MFTNNMILLMDCFASSYDNSSNTYGFKNTVGESKKAKTAGLYTSGFKYHMGFARCTTFNNTGTGSAGVYFGTGSTPATVNDYKLENPITSGLSITNSGNTIVENVNDGQYSLVATYSVKNTTDSDINIYEIGLFDVCMDGDYTDSRTFLTLIERTVLTEPITIKAGQTKIITYKITFNQTLNVEV